jgi:hypothetical protein
VRAFLVLAGGVGQLHKFLRRIHSRLEEPSEGDLGDGLFVLGDGQAALSDVEGTLGRTPVVFGIIQDPLFDPVGS